MKEKVILVEGRSSCATLMVEATKAGVLDLCSGSNRHILKRGPNWHGNDNALWKQ